MVVILCEFCSVINRHELLPSFTELMTRIRQMALLLYIINFSKLCFRVKNEMMLISAKKSCTSEQYF